MKRLRSCGLCFALLICAGGARAEVTLDEVTVPVKVLNTSGREIEHDIKVTLYLEASAPKPYPLLVLNHGRSGNGAERAKLKATDYGAAARWLTGFGFLVAVPVRMGYGVTGGPDIEYSGGCGSMIYPPGYSAAAAQTLAVLAQLRAREDVAKDRALVMGQSYGGATAIAVAALNPPGVQGTVNFAGGGGGDPVRSPMYPCRDDLLKDLFAGYGATARLPTLWLYSENDQYWGPKLPVEWFEAFKAAGGTGEFAAFPPVGEDGHRLFARAPQLWRPRLLEFLNRLGYSRLN